MSHCIFPCGFPQCVSVFILFKPFPFFCHGWVTQEKRVCAAKDSISRTAFAKVVTRLVHNSGVHVASQFPWLGGRGSQSCRVKFEHDQEICWTHFLSKESGVVGCLSNPSWLSSSLTESMSRSKILIYCNLFWGYKLRLSQYKTI